MKKILIFFLFFIFFLFLPHSHAFGFWLCTDGTKDANGNYNSTNGEFGGSYCGATGSRAGVGCTTPIQHCAQNTICITNFYSTACHTPESVQGCTCNGQNYSCTDGGLNATFSGSCDQIRQDSICAPAGTGGFSCKITSTNSVDCNLKYNGICVNGSSQSGCNPSGNYPVANPGGSAQGCTSGLCCAPKPQTDIGGDCGPASGNQWCNTTPQSTCTALDHSAKALSDTGFACLLCQGSTVGATCTPPDSKTGAGGCCGDLTCDQGTNKCVKRSLDCLNEGQVCGGAQSCCQTSANGDPLACTAQSSGQSICACGQLNQSCSATQQCCNSDGRAQLECVNGLCQETKFAVPPDPCPGQNGRCTSLDTAVGTIDITDPSAFIKSAFGVLLSISGGIALLIIIFAGYRIMTAQADPEKLKGAREMLTSAIIGLLFMIFSVAILQILGVDIFHIPGLSR